MVLWQRTAVLVVGSTLVFGALRWGLRRSPVPAHVRRDPVRSWRWRNLLVSFAHSVIAGLWALRGAFQMPEIFFDLINMSPPSGHLLICFSTGYFIHDSLDIILSHQSRASWEYLVHHGMSISALLSGLLLNRFVGAAVLLLFVEVSNIFLTIRMLMRVGHLQYPVLYEVNKYINLVMYFLFRLAPQSYLSWYFVRYVEVRGVGAFLMVNLILLDTMILVYFSRLLRTDFWSDPQKRDPDNERKFLND